MTIDPTKMANPDLDIRYDLFDHLNELFPDTLTDNGYDYIGEKPLLQVCIGTSKPLIGLQYEAILEAIVSFDKHGADFAQAIEVSYDGMPLYPKAAQTR